MSKYRCERCHGTNVYALELRTDCNYFRSIDPYNEDTECITNDDLPKYMGVDYCHDCMATVKVYKNDDELCG